MEHSRPLFSSFQYSWQWNVQYKFLPMTGFEPLTSGIGSDWSTNWATPLPLLTLYFKSPICGCLLWWQYLFLKFLFLASRLATLPGPTLPTASSTRCLASGTCSRSSDRTSHRYQTNRLNQRRVFIGPKAESWNILSAHSITLFTHFKTSTKSIDIYKVLRCCVLMKKSKHSES